MGLENEPVWLILGDYGSLNEPRGAKRGNSPSGVSKKLRRAGKEVFKLKTLLEIYVQIVFLFEFSPDRIGHQLVKTLV
jgi:hypothetical protein